MKWPKKGLLLRFQGAVAAIAGQAEQWETAGVTLAGRTPKDRLRGCFSKGWLRQFSILVSRKDGFRSIREMHPVILRLFSSLRKCLAQDFYPCFRTGLGSMFLENMEFFSKTPRVLP